MSAKNKKLKEVVDNLTNEEKESLNSITKELGKKIGFYFAGPFGVIVASLYIFTDFNIYLKIVTVIILGVVIYLLCYKFIITPYRGKQFQLLNNSEYATRNNMSI